MTDDRKSSVELEERIKLNSPNEAADEEEKPDVAGDRMNLFMLFLLYTLQNILFDIIMVMPMFLQKRGASYDDQALL